MQSTSSEALPPAPLWRRIAAIVYDSILLIAMWFVTTMVYLTVKGMVIGVEAMKALAESDQSRSDYVLTAVLFQVTFLFFTYFWCKSGQTLGMQAWRIKLVSSNEIPISWKQCILRFASACISAIIVGLGYLWMLWDSNKSTWHDRFSQTRIVLVPPKPKDKKK